GEAAALRKWVGECARASAREGSPPSVFSPARRAARRPGRRPRLRRGQRTTRRGNASGDYTELHCVLRPFADSGGHMSSYDAVIIGTGQSGKPLAIALARAGWKIAVIEREHVGGTCINVGCTPTKTMVASGRVAYLARRAKDYGVNAGRVTVNMRRVVDRKRRMVESFRNSGQETLEKTANLELIFGEARFKN